MRQTGKTFWQRHIYEICRTRISKDLFRLHFVKLCPQVYLGLSLYHIHSDENIHIIEPGIALVPNLHGCTSHLIPFLWAIAFFPMGFFCTINDFCIIDFTFVSAKYPSNIRRMRVFFLKMISKIIPVNNEVYFKFSGPLLVLISSWISKYIHNELWNEITRPFPNFNGLAIEDLE